MWQYSNEIYHHGIMGQKWGVRRFQNKDGTLTPAGKKRYNLDADGNLVEKTRAEKKAYKNQVRTEKKREKLLDKMDPEAIYKNKKLFTTSELRSMSERMAVEKSIADLYDPGKKFVDGLNNTARSLDAAGKIVESGTKLYNQTAKIINSVSNATLPVVGERKKSSMELETERLVRENANLKAKKENAEYKEAESKRKINEKYNINDLTGKDKQMKLKNSIEKEKQAAENLKAAKKQNKKIEEAQKKAEEALQRQRDAEKKAKESDKEAKKILDNAKKEAQKAADELREAQAIKDKLQQQANQSMRNELKVSKVKWDTTNVSKVNGSQLSDAVKKIKASRNK